MNSRSAWPNDARAGVNTGSVPHRDRGTDESFHWGRPGLVSVHAAVTKNKAAAKGSRRKAAFFLLPSLLAGTTKAAHEVNEVPGVGVGNFALQALHFVRSLGGAGK